MTAKRTILLIAFATLAALFAPVAEAAELAGHWVSAGITQPGGEEETELLDGFPIRLCAHYQLNANGSFEAVVFGAWFAGSWTPSGEDTALLEIVEKAETGESLPEQLTVKDGRIVYKDKDGLVFRLARVEGNLDVDALLEEIQAELE